MEREPKSLAVVIPCYRVEDQIAGVIRSLPPWVAHVIAVNDASPDGTGEQLESLAREFPHLHVLSHSRNQGVGGAMVSGFRKALEVGADIIVKLDGDGQMDVAQLPALIAPLLEGRAEYAKGNRLHKARDMAQMPSIRLSGNILLTYLTKASSGYWHISDPQNGYVAITRSVLEKLPLDRIDKSYFFENSMLANLNIHDAPVIDVSMPAIYGGEQSSMSLWRISGTFPFKLLRAGLRRILLKYLIYDVSPVFVYLVVGALLLGFSLIFGSYHWWLSYTTRTPASTGTVVLALLPFLLGFQLWLEALNYDIRSSPRPSTQTQGIRLQDLPKMLKRCEP